MADGPTLIERRRALSLIAAGGAGLVTSPLWAQSLVDLHLPGGPGTRLMTTDFPGKGPMILQRSRAPLLETPMAAMDGHVFTPNDRFFVRWHYSDMPLEVNVQSFRLNILGAVKQPLPLSLAELLKMPRFEIAAINQCSGNSRGYFEPRVPGAQWGNGAIGNAKWTGVRLKDVLDRAGVAANAVQVRFSGLDTPPPDAPLFAKSLDLAHAMDGEVMIAFQMNGAQLPMLHGFPIRLVVPGWYSTYWVKALDRIELLDTPDTGYWMEKAYRIPDTPRASVAPDAKGYPTVPINRMGPRSFITNIADGARVAANAPLKLRGLAMGGASGVARVDLSQDGGRTWFAATTGPDQGKYGFRSWNAVTPALATGDHKFAVRCTGDSGEVQTFDPIWNPGGFTRNSIETTMVRAA
ncbi:MAG: molybdopterin-dependent oxidoreductase [Sphingomonas bacterium]